MRTFLALVLFANVLASSSTWGQEKKDAIPEAVTVDATANPKISKPQEPKIRPLTVNIELLSQASIAGTMTEANQIDIKTAFGVATIPMSEIAGIRLATAQDASTTIVMLNGDSITGATDIKQITIDTEWGSARINGSAIQAILFVPDLKWVNSNSINGRRWFLVDAKQATANSPGTSPNPSSTGGNSVSGQPTPSTINPNRPSTPINPNPSTLPR